MGYFFQELAPDGELLSDLDSLFGGLTGVELAAMLAGSEEALIAALDNEQALPDSLNREHIARMMLDLPF
jgi:hypothetical protein